MAKKQESKLHAEHVENVCSYLDKNPNFSDWVITTSFYSSLHYLRYKIFPFNHLLKKGVPPVRVETFEEYHSVCTSSIGSMGRHERFKCLVEKKCPTNIAGSYNRLLELSYTARYTNYKFEKPISDDAKSKLEIIKLFCV